MQVRRSDTNVLGDGRNVPVDTISSFMVFRLVYKSLVSQQNRLSSLLLTESVSVFAIACHIASNIILPVCSFALR
jgi:hypothetical protein